MPPKKGLKDKRAKAAKASAASAAQRPPSQAGVPAAPVGGGLRKTMKRREQRLRASAAGGDDGCFSIASPVRQRARIEASATATAAVSTATATATATAARANDPVSTATATATATAARANDPVDAGLAGGRETPPPPARTTDADGAGGGDSDVTRLPPARTGGESLASTAAASATATAAVSSATFSATAARVDAPAGRKPPPPPARTTGAGGASSEDSDVTMVPPSRADGASLASTAAASATATTATATAAYADDPVDAGPAASLEPPPPPATAAVSSATFSATAARVDAPAGRKPPPPPARTTGAGGAGSEDSDVTMVPPSRADGASLVSTAAASATATTATATAAYEDDPVDAGPAASREPPPPPATAAVSSATTFSTTARVVGSTSTLVTGAWLQKNFPTVREVRAEVEPSLGGSASIKRLEATIGTPGDGAQELTAEVRFSQPPADGEPPEHARRRADRHLRREKDVLRKLAFEAYLIAKAEYDASRAMAARTQRAVEQQRLAAEEKRLADEKMCAREGAMEPLIALIRDSGPVSVLSTAASVVQTRARTAVSALADPSSVPTTRTAGSEPTMAAASVEARVALRRFIDARVASKRSRLHRPSASMAAASYDTSGQPPPPPRAKIPPTRQPTQSGRSSAPMTAASYDASSQPPPPRAKIAPTRQPIQSGALKRAQEREAQEKRHRQVREQLAEAKRARERRKRHGIACLAAHAREHGIACLAAAAAAAQEIANLAANPELHAAVAAAFDVRTARTAKDYADTEKARAVLAIWKARTPAALERLGSLLPSLVALVRDGAPDVQAHAARALADLQAGVRRHCENHLFPHERGALPRGVARPLPATRARLSCLVGDLGRLALK